MSEWRIIINAILIIGIVSVFAIGIAGDNRNRQQSRKAFTKQCLDSGGYVPSQSTPLKCAILAHPKE